MNDQKVHAAEVLARQIDRVSGLLRTLGDLYAPTTESFAAGNSFVAHGLMAAGSLLEEAHGALEQLTVTAEAQFAEPPTPPIVYDDTQQDQPMVFPPIESLELGQHSESATIHLVSNEPSATVVRDDEFAQSYLELLRKLTAAEVFAAEQQALAPPGTGQNLLPLLRSLREEFQKLHRVA
jgi:hypothetical protein